MKRIIDFISENILLVLTLFLLVFIPLYPKFPLLDLKNTWVYIRIEDFIMVIVWGAFFLQLIRKKATVKTPLTIPIVVFWLIGGIATIHGVLFLFPHMTGAFPQLALFYWLRHIEYLSVFFLAFSAMRKKSFVTPLVTTLAVTMIAVFLYGIGQRYLGFPAYLTMNEEFAKGIPLRLSPLARIPSTFAGHYDLAAYLTLLIPVMGSMVLGFKKWYARLFFFLTAFASLVLLLMTASRVSYGVYLVSITLLLILHKQKKLIFPVIVASLILLQAFPGLSSRFASTFQQVDLVVDSRTGKAIGVASEFGDGQVVIEDQELNGEGLQTGSKYVNIPTQTGSAQETQITYKKLTPGSKQPQIITKSGKVIVKKAFAYDVSFTTRFQGEWPRAMDALKRNLILGSGYSSINLATDNNYLRTLGEIGILGIGSFLMIFLMAGIYLWRVLPSINDKRSHAFVLGVFAGGVGVALNAILIDVFEASKLAFVLWTILGAAVGLAHLYQEKPVHFLSELKSIFVSRLAYAIYLAVAGFLIFFQTLNNYFVADDFFWLRGAADCMARVTKSCEGLIPTITSYFLNAQNFYYRPGVKSLFYITYPVFELFPSPYHVISLLVHIATTIIVFFFSRKLLRSSIFGFLTAFLFLILSIHYETIFWISTIGHTTASMFLLLSLLSFVYYRETKKSILLAISWIAILCATFFQEFAIIGPLLLIGYDVVADGREGLRKWKLKWYYLVLLLLIPLNLFMRTNADSLIFAGDYRYNFSKLPLNIVGNTLSYIVLSVFGPDALPTLQNLRLMASSNIALTAIVMILIFSLVVLLLTYIWRKVSKETMKILLIGLVIFFVPLIPFLGFGNVAPRYAYLASFGVCLVLVYFFQKLYMKAKAQTKNVYLGLAFLIVVVISLYNLVVLDSLNKDWQRAGEIVNNALVGVTLNSVDETQIASTTLYFVDVPIRYKSAWIFPVGLTDAMWFSFKDANIISIPLSEEAKAQKKADYSKRVRVFKFLNDYSIVEYTPPAIPSAKPVL